MAWERKSADQFLNEPLRLVGYRVHHTALGVQCLLFVQSVRSSERHGIVRTLGVDPHKLANVSQVILRKQGRRLSVETPSGRLLGKSND